MCILAHFLHDLLFFTITSSLKELMYYSIEILQVYLEVHRLKMMQGYVALFWLKLIFEEKKFLYLPSSLLGTMFDGLYLLELLRY